MRTIVSTSWFSASSSQMLVRVSTLGERKPEPKGEIGAARMARRADRAMVSGVFSRRPTPSMNLSVSVVAEGGGIFIVDVSPGVPVSASSGLCIGMPKDSGRGGISILSFGLSRPLGSPPRNLGCDGFFAVLTCGEAHSCHCCASSVVSDELLHTRTRVSELSRQRGGQGCSHNNKPRHAALQLAWGLERRERAGLGRRGVARRRLLPVGRREDTV